MERSSGILMPVFSLPSPGGIGTLGQAAYDFIDFLAAAKQRWWQMLPAGPTAYGDSPYQSCSCFAGNPYFIDPKLLARDGLLTAEELRCADCGGDAVAVDYGALYRSRPPLLRLAAQRCLSREPEAVAAFAHRAPWLPDYALFMALKAHFDMLPLTRWPEDIRLRRPEALTHYRTLLAADIACHSCVQYLFFRQWTALRTYAKQKGIGIIGDLPIYVSRDSAEVWAEPGFFRLDGRGDPAAVAGVPPDYFSAEGQLWGNPLYDWNAMGADGFGWWIRRIDGAAKLYDAVRIDHFRGFERYWAVPAEADTAAAGHWEEGPGMALLSALNGWFPDMEFLAEDLGILTPAVTRLRDEAGWPGMQVLQFAFHADSPSTYLPHAHREHSVCFTGTHDNTTLEDWRRTLSRRDLNYAKRYLGISSASELRGAVLRAGMGSVARLFIAPMADWLGLGGEARINTPGTGEGNWRWRMRPDALTSALAKEIAGLTVLYGRDCK